MKSSLGHKFWSWVSLGLCGLRFFGPSLDLGFVYSTDRIVPHSAEAMHRGRTAASHRAPPANSRDQATHATPLRFVPPTTESPPQQTNRLQEASSAFVCT